MQQLIDHDKLSITWWRDFDEVHKLSLCKLTHAPTGCMLVCTPARAREVNYFNVVTVNALRHNCAAAKFCFSLLENHALKPEPTYKSC